MGEKAFLESTEKELKALLDSVMLLSTFVRLNYTAALKVSHRLVSFLSLAHRANFVPTVTLLSLQILKKHDKYTPFNIKPVFVVRLGAREFDKDHLEPTIIRLSAVYDALRKRAAGESLDTKKATANAAGGDFVRRTTKYWVHPGEDSFRTCHVVDVILKSKYQYTSDHW